MHRNRWTTLIKRWVASSRHPKRILSSRRATFRPILEHLESRVTPTVFPTVGPGDVTTLIADINAANLAGGSNTINLTASTYSLPGVGNNWYGPNGLPAITSNLTIHGNGATIFRDSGDAPFRFFYVSGGMELPAGSLTMDNLTLEGGLAEGGNSNLGGGGLGAGGAIFNQGTLTLSAVTLTDNEALGGSSGVSTDGDGGGGIGGDAPASGDGGDGGGFGGSLPGGPFGGNAGDGTFGGGGGGGGGFVTGANGGSGSTSGFLSGTAGGLGGFGTGGGDGGAGADSAGISGDGGAFGSGGSGGSPGGSANGGGGGVGGGGGGGYVGGGGGFGGGGGAGGEGGFGGGGGAIGINGGTDSGGFGGGAGIQTASGGGGAALGGAIFNMGADSTSGQATLINCTLASNTAQGGSGGTNGVSGNGFGGALFNLDGTTTLLSDTLASNTVVNGGSSNLGGPADGGAVYNLAFGNDIPTGAPVTATLGVLNSILANSTGGPDLGGQAINGAGTNTATISANSNLVQDPASNITLPASNITNTDPQLGKLTITNGGLTPTMLPLGTSPVISTGATSFLTPSTDQRGQPRPAAGPIDIGSVQGTVPLSPPASPPAGSPPGGLPPAPPAGSPAPHPAPPPSMFQAWVSLFLDGARLEANALGSQFGVSSFINDTTPSNPGPDAAAEEVLDELDAFLGILSNDAIDADIAFNLPNAGPFGEFLVLDGATAVSNAVGPLPPT
jgi:hypothetical protein